MKALILAAGEGRRMLPLTRDIPKPLLPVKGRSLIEHQIGKLVKNGIRDIVINHAWLGEKIEMALGDGARLGARLSYSREGQPLETAGGIIRALPLLGDRPFMVVNADIWTDYPFRQLESRPQPGCLAHLVMVSNAAHHPAGDFCLGPEGLLAAKAGPGQQTLTYSGISVFRPAFFAGLEPGFRALAPLLTAAIARQQVSGEFYGGTWQDIGTPERLRALAEGEP
ncbi:MAG: nucleotidyltransferase family protein [Pseudomonadales bacterium]|nr:nucleotidyltransferase family protein [Pseudomonadales bacterium]